MKRFSYSLTWGFVCVRKARGAFWSVVYRCVNKKKNDEKGYFFRAGQWAALLSFRVGKMLFFVGKVCVCVFFFFTNFTKCCRIKRECVIIYYIGNGQFLTGHSEKEYQFQNVEQTV